MTFKWRFLLIGLILAQLLVWAALAEESEEEEASFEEMPWAEEIGDYRADISASVKRGKEVVLKQKRELEEKEKSQDQIAEEMEEKEEEARREVYEQKIITEAAMPRSLTTLERQLKREKFRREIMAQAGREAEVPFRLRKRFHMRLSETYDDNIYLTKVDKKEDYITTVSPSILFSLNSKYIALDANYVMDITHYKNREDLSGISHLLATYLRPGSLPFLNRRHGKIGIEVQDDFQPLVTSVATSEQTETTERTYNKLFLAIDYYMSTKRTLALEYTNTYQHYNTSSLENYSYMEQIYSPVFYFHIRPKWSIFTGYDYGIFDYSKGTGDSTRHRLRTGITGTFLKKVLTHLEIGKEWRFYKDSEKGEGQAAFFKSALLDKFTPQTTGSLEYAHTMEESTYTNNSYYICDDIKFNLEHKFTYKTAGIFEMEFIQNSYDMDTVEDGETEKRRDYLLQPHVGLRYCTKRWMSFDLDYTHKRRLSNFGKFDYRDNRITSRVNIQF